MSIRSGAGLIVRNGVGAIFGSKTRNQNLRREAGTCCGDWLSLHKPPGHWYNKRPASHRAGFIPERAACSSFHPVGKAADPFIFVQHVPFDFNRA
ncbi:hypothetical protein BM1_01722 [Bipolaris maydis]|nr:hypothetical protein BM1_01722 [Bipolaris maydis]